MIGPIIGSAIMVSFVIICRKILDTSIIVLFLSLAVINLVWAFINRRKPPGNSDSSGDGGGGDWFGDSGSGSHGHGHHDGGGFFDGGGHGGDGGGGH
jgi:hypothetical protein